MTDDEANYWKEPARPGTILPVWEIVCHLCKTRHSTRFAYDEASMWLTNHLNDVHTGWAEPLPTRPGYYVVKKPRDDGTPAVVELLNSPKGQWAEVTGVSYLNIDDVLALGPLRRLVVAGEVKPEDLDVVEHDDFVNGLIEENRALQNQSKDATSNA